MFKVRPIRNDCPSCYSKFEQASSKEDEPAVIEKAAPVEVGKKKGKKKKSVAKKEVDTSVDPSVIQLYRI